MSENDSPHIEEAKAIIEGVRGQSLTAHRRKKEALNLALHLLREAQAKQTFKQKARQSELSRMMHDRRGKAFTAAFTDRCFRSSNPATIIEQICHLIDTYGIPQYLSRFKKLELFFLRLLGLSFPAVFVKLAVHALKKNVSPMIISSDHEPFQKHLQKRKAQGFSLNINHLGEAILGEQEAQRRLNLYLNDLMDENIESISIKISTLYSQVSTLAYEDTIEKLSERLRELFRVAKHHTYTDHNGEVKPKFIHLDMEAYSDMHLSIASFKKVLSEAEFTDFYAGIVLQAYLPDSFRQLQLLTTWSTERVQNGGAPIRIRIVKGANIAMEDVDASLHSWPRAPYLTKVETDANFKKMLDFALCPKNIESVHIGVGSHNLFDIAYALILKSMQGIEEGLVFEMLEGMCDHIRDVTFAITGKMILYAPCAPEKDFQHVIAYLFRRLDENTGPDNFLRYSFDLKPGSDEWDMQATMFSESCKEIESVSDEPRRTQNRFDPPQSSPSLTSFENEPDTDFSLPENSKWAYQTIERWKNHSIDPIPLVVGTKSIYHHPAHGHGYDKSSPQKPDYSYSLATQAEIDQALIVAEGHAEYWANIPIPERCGMIKKLAQIFRERRGDLIGVMVKDGGKSFEQADKELSEAVDFAEYYAYTMHKLGTMRDLDLRPKGIYLVASPWNFPVAIPAGGIIGALLTGNCVLFKPAPETVYAGYMLANCFWDAGIPKGVLQFVPMEDDPEGSALIQNPRLTGVILTGSTQTAQKFIQMRPNLDISAETGGKNAMIITANADRDLAVKNLIDSAFGHNGQKCSATSLAICVPEVYNDPSFRRQLRDAAASLHVGSAFDLASKITPLIAAPNEKLLRGLTMLEPGEEWLLKPRQDARNPNLWSPGIKLGVKKGSFTHQNELFGPLLGVMCAKNLDHAITLANGTRYGLTSGLQSLDEREHHKWQKAIRAGNLYINRTTTGSIIRRQPFGGTKQSSFGFGVKAGGSNYLIQFMHIKQMELPKEKYPVSDLVNNLTPLLEKFDLSTEEQGLWFASLSNYGFWWQRLGNEKDRHKIIGQDNLFRYIPRKKVALRILPDDRPIDTLRVIAAALTCGTPLQVSWDPAHVDFPAQANWELLLPNFSLHRESEEALLKRIKNHDIRRLRILQTPSKDIATSCGLASCTLSSGPVLANGRYELLHYVRELIVSIDYHRYGNLGIREGELRKQNS